MTLGLSTLVERLLVERLLVDSPWATCPAESFAERFAELEQRLRAAYPAERGFSTRVWRKKSSWVVYVRKGPWSGFAIQCEPIYGAESFNPARVSVWVGTHSRGIHLALYPLVALTWMPLVPLAKYLAPRVFTNPVTLVAFWLLFPLIILGLFPFLATLLGVVERSGRGKAQLEDVRALVRSVLGADDRVLLPQRTRARRLQLVLEAVAVCTGLIALGAGSWAFWQWWSFWDDPINCEVAQGGALETMQNVRAIFLIFGAVLSLSSILSFWGYALLRQRATQEQLIGGARTVAWDVLAPPAVPAVERGGSALKEFGP